MRKKNIIVLFGLVAFGLIVGILFFSPGQQTQAINDNISMTRDTSLNVGLVNNVSAALVGDHSMGSDELNITIVEYASLTCPHCATFHGEVFPRIKSDLIDTGIVRYIFRDFPIDPIAMAGSMIAHCSGDDKYFGVIDVLLKTQDEWLFENENPYNGLLKVARLAGLSEEDVKMCLNDTDLFNLIENNQKIATTKFGVSGTPSVFVNNKKISTLDYDTIIAELNNIKE